MSAVNIFKPLTRSANWPRTGLMRRRMLWAYAFVAAPLLGLLVFWIGPILFSGWVSLHDWDMLSPPAQMPWRGLDKKIPEAKQQIAAFYHDRFPSGYSEISNSVDKIASESGVKISSEKYDQKEAEVDNIQLVEIQADVSGDYLQLVRFINTLERSKLFFIVKDLQIAGLSVVLRNRDP